jgi:AraC-like DNA-binding protein
MDLSGESDFAAIERRPIFSVASAPLDGRQILEKQQLARRLRADALSELEADECALWLLSVCAKSATTMVRRPVKRRRTHARREQRVEATLLTLSTQPQVRWDLSQLARRVHSSPWHLAREFRRVVGLSLHQFQLLARLASALDHVIDSDLPLTSLAADLGFSSHSHFTAAFHKCFGCTPTQLRHAAHPATVRELRTVSHRTRDALAACDSFNNSGR